ncbi:hypothetical protein BRARA_C02337 [Brassica rapa]|uniref:1-phosphatidylinositol 4-kinase n=1 Tax=Brassica campestris TaxID=3711 RepID=A0A397ZXJ7_BRACM|nr:hypothetical protein BRARA_C02337 [Brassica rapa]
MSSADVTLSPVRNEPSMMPLVHANSCADSLPDETILIYLTLPGTLIPRRVLESDSIESVKLRIQSYRGFVSNSNMRDYGVSDGNVLHLVVKVSDLQVLDVKTTCGKHCRFHVERGRNIGYVKKQISKQKGGDFVDSEVLYEGEKLEDQSLVNDICRNSDAVLHLLVRRSAKVRAKPVEKNFELSIVAPPRVDDVKRVIEADDGIVQPRKQLLNDFSLEPVIVNPKAELPEVVKDMVSSASDGLRSGNPPVRSREGTGGAYFMQGSSGNKYVGVFKPLDEEPTAENNPHGLPLSPNGEGLKKGTKVGEGALREVAAYILDHPKSGRRYMCGEEMGFAGVPPTTMIECLHPGFNHPNGIKTKIGSLQMFTENDGSCEDMGPASFPVEEVHKISFEDCTFEWLYWSQARKPYSSETLDYIRSLDAEEDISLLKFHGWKMPLETARTLRISTMLLKKGAERGLTAFEIGNMMCRETLTKKSLVEELVEEAEEAVLPETSEVTFMEALSDVMDYHLDEVVRV